MFRLTSQPSSGVIVQRIPSVGYPYEYHFPVQTVHSLFHRWPVSHTWSTLMSRIIYIYTYPIKTQFTFDETIRDCAHVTTVVFPHDAIQGCRATHLDIRTSDHRPLNHFYLVSCTSLSYICNSLFLFLCV
jgi:hypothetical protein